MHISELFGSVYSSHWSLKRYDESGWAKEVQGYYMRHIKPALGENDATLLTPSQVRKFHSTLAASSVSTANRCLSVLSKMYAYGQQEGLLNHNPCLFVRPMPERVRDRVASESEIVRLRAAFESLQKEYPREIAYFRLLFLTGARPKSLQGLTFSKLSFASNKALYVFSGKGTASSGYNEIVVIPEAGIEILAALKERVGDAVFKGMNARKVWKKACFVAGVKGLWMRDARRTFASAAFSAGLDLGSVGQLLNHRNLNTTKKYARLSAHALLTASDKVPNVL